MSNYNNRSSGRIAAYNAIQKAVLGEHSTEDVCAAAADIIVGIACVATNNLPSAIDLIEEIALGMDSMVHANWDEAAHLRKIYHSKSGKFS